MRCPNCNASWVPEVGDAERILDAVTKALLGEAERLAGGEWFGSALVVRDAADFIRENRDRILREAGQEPTTDALDAADKATALAERYGEAIVSISAALAEGTPGGVNRARAMIAGLEASVAGPEKEGAR